MEINKNLDVFRPVITTASKFSSAGNISYTSFVVHFLNLETGGGFEVEVTLGDVFEVTFGGIVGEGFELWGVFVNVDDNCK